MTAIKPLAFPSPLHRGERLPDNQPPPQVNLLHPGMLNLLHPGMLNLLRLEMLNLLRLEILNLLHLEMLNLPHLLILLPLSLPPIEVRLIEPEMCNGKSIIIRDKFQIADFLAAIKNLGFRQQE
jgi:hypothetical protein